MFVYLFVWVGEVGRLNNNVGRWVDTRGERRVSSRL